MQRYLWIVCDVGGVYVPLVQNDVDVMIFREIELGGGYCGECDSGGRYGQQILRAILLDGGYCCDDYRDGYGDELRRSFRVALLDGCCDDYHYYDRNYASHRFLHRLVLYFA